MHAVEYRKAALITYASFALHSVIETVFRPYRQLMLTEFGFKSNHRFPYSQIRPGSRGILRFFCPPFSTAERFSSIISL